MQRSASSCALWENTDKMAVSNEVIRALVEEDEEETFILITVAAVVCACVKMMQWVMLGLMEETGEFRDPTAHVENYVEVTVPRYADRQFHEHFRMGRDVFERLLEWIAPSMPHERTIRLEKSVLVTVWYIGNMETYRSIADRFGLNKGSVKRIVVTVCGILTQRQGELIKWPTSIAEMEVLAQEFQERCDFPGVVGAVDGTHVKILPPNDFRDSYFNKNGTPSLQLQVVANHNLLFLDVFCGYPGSVHDARVWRNCPLKEKVENELPRQFHLLGDSAYGLERFMMTPFRNDGHLDRVRKNYNAAHSSTRVEVERAIGLLKGKWRKLKFLEMLVVDDMMDVIMAACTLHNFVLVNHGIDDDHIADDAAAGAQNEEQDIADEQAPQLAQDKRMEIAYLLL